MHENYNNAILYKISELQNQIDYFNSVLNAERMTEISLNLFTIDKDGYFTLHNWNQSCFEIKLQYEIVKLINEEIDQLQIYINELTSELNYAS